MKIRIGFYLSLVLLVSCVKESERNSEVMDLERESSWVSAPTNSFINEILGSGNASIRGFNLGDSISYINRYEKWEQFEKTDELLGFTFETEDFEIVDVLYMFDSTNKLIEVQLDIYLNSDAVSFEIMKALDIYFTQKYGKPKKDFKQPTWSISKSEFVTIKNIASKLDRGLQVNFKLN